MAEKIYLADKETLDNIYKNTSSIITKLNNDNQIILNPMEYDVILETGKTYFDKTRTIISIDSNKKGGFFKFLSLEAPMREHNSGSKNMTIKITIDDKTYIQRWDDTVNKYCLELTVYKNNINTQYNFDEKSYDFGKLESKFDFKYLSKNNYFPDLSDIFNREYESSTESKNIKAIINNPFNGFVFFKDKIEVMINGTKSNSSSRSAIYKFLGGIKK